MLLQKELHSSETMYNISETRFQPGTEYIAKVYTEVIQTAVYQGTRSHGSAEIRWKTPQAGKSVVGVTVGDKNNYAIIYSIEITLGILFVLLIL